MEQQPTQPTKQAKQPAVMVEVAGGYLLGATIVSFLSLWLTAWTNLATTL
ncbi:MAG: hypothetical protein HY567_03950 [Candidatus Kerfeldbacteria bacterium]|nr:hypothetical protein [Candidatus Kerfeldbacteria bacterium]